VKNLIRLIGLAPSELDSISRLRLVRREHQRAVSEIEAFREAEKPSPSARAKPLAKAKTEFEQAQAQLRKMLGVSNERLAEIVEQTKEDK